MTDIPSKTAPVQRFGRIPWGLHLRAYEAYAKQYGTSQSAARLAERGGFGIGEMDMFVPGWRNELRAITGLREAYDMHVDGTGDTASFVTAVGEFLAIEFGKDGL